LKNKEKSIFYKPIKRFQLNFIFVVSAMISARGRAWTILLGVIILSSGGATVRGQTFPGIGLNGLPADSDSICAIPVYTGNFNVTGYQVSDTVPDFTLYDYNGNAFNLHSALQTGVPVVLIAGSLTCPVYRGKIAEINQMAAVYGNQLQIFIVYTVEAHPIIDISPYSGTVWVTSQNQTQNILFRQPVTYGERKAMVDTMLSLYTINVPVLIDGPCNNWWLNYGPAPNNAYLIDTSGVVVAKHPWFNKAPLNMFCAVDSLIGFNSGLCNTYGNNGLFTFALDLDSVAYGQPGQTLAIHATLTNISSNQNVVIDIVKKQVNIPSGWASALCADICHAPTVDSIRITIPPSTVQPFIFYFYTDLTPNQGMVGVLFRNAFNGQNRFRQGFYGYTNFTGTEWPSLTDELLIFPNPATSAIQLKGYQEYDHYILTDVTGRRIQQGVPADYIPIKETVPGQYLITLSGEKGTVVRMITLSGQ
jgi:hypothetical protein